MNFGHRNELHAYNTRQRIDRNRSVLKQVLVVVGCVIAIVAIQSLGVK